MVPLHTWVKNMETKKDIRKVVFQRRKEATQDMIKEASHKIFEKIIELPEFKERDWLFAYVDFNNEVMTKELMAYAWSQGKRVAVPRVEGSEMVYYEITSFDQLQPGYYGIEEPQGCPEAECEEALLIVPGVAFDCKRHRVGYGGGFYDKYLSAHPGHASVAVAFEFQIFDKVPFEKLDILPKKIVTENNIFQ